MGWLSRTLTYLAGPAIEQIVTQRLAEAVPSAGAIDTDEHLYRRLSGNAQRDLSPVTQRRMLQIAHHLAQTNPFAKWLLDTTRDFVCGEGVTITAEDPAIQEVLDMFWQDPINRMDMQWPEMVRELGLFGEQCWPVFLDETTGLLRLSTIDPSRIKSIIHDPDNAREPIGVVLLDSAGTPGKKLRILKGAPDETLFAPTALRLRQEMFIDGDCFYYAINKASASETRGISDLFALSDWLDGYEQLVWNTLDRTGFMNAFCWDWTLEDADAAAIAAWKQSNPAPKPGSNVVHNQKVTLKAVTPDLQSEDTERHARIFRNHILGASGFPEHWYGGGGDVNRATAAEMSAPTMKALQYRQRTVKMILEDVLRLQISQAQAMRHALRRVPIAFTVTMPRMDAANIREVATALGQVAGAAMVAEDRGWTTREQSAQLFATTAALLGIELDTSALETPVPREFANG